MALFVFAIQITGYHSKHRTTHICIERNVNRMVLFIIPMCVSRCSMKRQNQTQNHEIEFESKKVHTTYSGDAINVPSNLYLYVIIAGIKNETTKDEANTALVHFVNFQIIIWIAVPQITNWKSAAKYHACCRHYGKCATFYFRQINFNIFQLTGSWPFTKLLMYSIFVHQLLRHASRSVSAKMGQDGPVRILYKSVALKSKMNE